MTTSRPRRAARALALGALAAALAPSAAGAAATKRAPVRDCGDSASQGAGSFAITAQGAGLTCKTAVAVARAVPPKRSCTSKTISTCTVRGYSCFVAQVGKELYLARCANSSQTKFVRFEFGS
jgi:hypothetical protein